jgi:hypothetical protein
MPIKNKIQTRVFVGRTQTDFLVRYSRERARGEVQYRKWDRGELIIDTHGNYSTYFTKKEDDKGTEIWFPLQKVYMDGELIGEYDVFEYKQDREIIYVLMDGDGDKWQVKPQGAGDNLIWNVIQEMEK